MNVVYQWFSCFCFLIYFPKLYICFLWSIKIYLQCYKTFCQVWYSITFRNILEHSVLYWFPVLWRENALLSYRLKTRTFWWCQPRNPPLWKNMLHHFVSFISANIYAKCHEQWLCGSNIKSHTFKHSVFETFATFGTLLVLL